MQTNKSILLLSDSDEVIQKIREALKASHSIVYAASTLDEALELLDYEKIDVVVAESSVPGSKGTDLIEKIRSWDAKLPIVLLSNEDNEDDLELMFISASAVIPKPYKKQTIIKTITKILQEKKLFPIEFSQLNI